jgi:pimeloyl-ACP methyl ester carboxylesterase
LVGATKFPFLQEQDYEVVAPDMLAYGGTSTPEDETAWSLKSISDDMVALCADVFSPGVKIILGGHDWGGVLAWRIALWQPELLRGVFSACVPFFPPNPHYVGLRTLVENGKLSTFSYQLQFINSEVEERIKTESDIRGLLLALYGGRTPDGNSGFSHKRGLVFNRLNKLGPSPLVGEGELETYVKAFSRQGIAGPFKWYGMGRGGFEEELPLAEKEGGVKIEVPSLFITALRDDVLLPSMSEGMEAYFADLTTKGADAAHWALWEAADGVNAHLNEWIRAKVEGDVSAL